jgi:cytochrome bd-type quinol oxidase subunit 2
MEHIDKIKADYNISYATESAIKKATKWAHIAAVITIVGIVIGLITNIIANINDGVTMVAKITALLISSALSICFAVFLFYFSKHTNHGLETKNQQSITKGFYNLKLYFNVIGIITVIFVSLFILIILLAALVGAAYTSKL